jgi:hypothetical protein
VTGPGEPEGDVAPTPRWVYAVGGLVILFAIAFVAMHLSSGGFVPH